MYGGMAGLVGHSVTRKVQQDDAVTGLGQRYGEWTIEVAVEQKAVQVYEKLRPGAVHLVRQAEAVVRELAFCHEWHRGQMGRIRAPCPRIVRDRVLRRFLQEHWIEDTQHLKSYRSPA